MKSPAEVAHGPMFIGFTCNVLLYGVMIIQVYLYFTTYKKRVMDKIWLKAYVMILLACDTANTVFDFIYLYNTLILHFGKFTYLEKADWLFATGYPAITGIIASLVQAFFAWRVFILTRSWPLAAAIFVGSLSGAAGSIATSFEVGRTPEFVNFQRFKGVVIMWLVSESVTDIVITGILVWYLVMHCHATAKWSMSEIMYLQNSHKTGFKQSDYMVDRIIRITVQTGMITSVVATLDLITFLTDPTGTHLIFNFPLCKLYTNSLMSSLNSRRGWKYGKGSTDNDSIPYFDSRNNAEGKMTLQFSPPSSARTPPTSPGFYDNSMSFADGGAAIELDDLSSSGHQKKASYSSDLISPIEKPVRSFSFMNRKLSG
ncbi:hypothetical protein CPC08DRAFT_761871 [Agrocybe pediades]|nr:hypothetical protein CPC08DRAFT_761871 [Agrocybe pediades]